MSTSQLLFRDSNTPRGIVFSLDMGISLISVLIAYQLRFNFRVPASEVDTFWYVFLSVVLVRALSFYVGKSYAGIIRYTSTKDAQRIFTVLTAGSAVLALANPISFALNGHYLVPFSIIIIDYLCTAFLMITLRVAVKLLYLELKNPTRDKSKIVIFGAGDSAIITKRTLDRDAGTKYRVVAFVDDNKKKEGKKIEGVRIYHADRLPDLLTSSTAHLVIAVQNMRPNRKREIVEQCLAQNIDVLTVPAATSWINGELSFKQIRHAGPEDLLGRDPIQLEEANIRNEIKGKTVLVTGAAGSIGCEMTRQIARFGPSKLILLDQAESPLYELDHEMQSVFGSELCEVVVGDIRHRDRMENLFATFQPELVFHTAAYKHVPLMELNPSEAIRTNVSGTRNMVDLAVQYKAEAFVMVSTDKAVNPTNIMGASKRIAEIYAQTANRDARTRFITTRFGNVLGSHGSVIPLFQRQIEQGGPVTVTHPEVTRFFMTIEEAAQLVLEASAMGEGGEIFAFDMGSSVKIVDLAKKMIQLAGLQLGRDIEIRYMGLRPGEKLFEEVLADKENTLPTHHPRILKARVRDYDREDFVPKLEQLIALYEKQDNEAIASVMKEIVPEYRSENSEFSKLDAPIKEGAK